jgi:hypothetical protein
MEEFSISEVHAIKKALAIAISMLEQKHRDVQSFANLDEMNAIFDKLVNSDIERETYARQVRVALTGAAD